MVINRLKSARAKVIIKNDFFGALSLLLDFNEQPDLTKTAATDGEYFYYNPAFIKTLSDNQLSSLVVHEVLHVALSHLWRKGKRDNHLWNIAADYVVNLILVSNGYEQVSKDGLYDTRFLGMSVEQVYIELENNSFSINVPSCGLGGDCKSCQDHKLWDKFDPNSKKSKEIQANFEGVMKEMSRMKGSIPAGFETYIKNLEGKEDWKKILASYISKSATDYDFLIRDRRTLQMPFYFPEISNTDKLEDIIVAVDTSGSISDDELNVFVAEVRKIIKSFGDVKGWLIECDSQVHQVLSLDKVKHKIKFIGRGGTSHIPVFDEIKKRKFKPRVLIAFTDLYTDFPKVKPDFPVLWLVPKSNFYLNNGQTVPFGRIIRLSGSVGKD